MLLTSEDGTKFICKEDDTIIEIFMDKSIWENHISELAYSTLPHIFKCCKDSIESLNEKLTVSGPVVEITANAFKELNLELILYCKNSDRAEIAAAHINKYERELYEAIIDKVDKMDSNLSRMDVVMTVR